MGPQSFASDQIGALDPVKVLHCCEMDYGIVVSQPWIRELEFVGWRAGKAIAAIAVIV